jgi:glutaredoxin
MLNKSIRHNKERREEYRGSASFDRSCRNNGACEYCRDNRRFDFNKMIQAEELEYKLMNDIDYTEEIQETKESEDLEGVDHLVP